MIKDLISVIVPVYNGEKFIENCVRSIQNQLYKNLDIVIVDDGSTDNTFSICQSIAEKDRRVRAYSISNGGTGYARNYGLERANGEFVGFCDADDTVDASMYDTLHSIIVDYDSDMVGCGHSVVKSGSLSFNRRDLKKDVHLENKLQALEAFSTQKGITWSVCDKLFRKEKIGNIHFPGGRIHAEDTLFLLDFITHNNRFCWSELGLYIRNTDNEDSITHQKWSKANLGLTVFYRKLFETVEEYSISEELTEKMKVRHYQNLLSTYIRCIKRNYKQEANVIHSEMSLKKKEMLKSSLSFFMKLDFLLCVFSPNLGPRLNFWYK